MAPAVTTTLKDEPELMWHGDGVKMAEVLEALNRIRADFARAEAGDHEHAHPRNCVMTLVAVSATQAEERRAQRTCRIIGAQHPAQSIVIREEVGAHGHGLNAWIVTDIQRPSMASAVECEIVTLHIHGAAADHIGPLVDPLLVSGVPTYLWWMGTPPFGKGELHEALRICDALVFDSSRFEEPYHALRGLSKLITIAHERLGLADLQWSRVRAWRESLAQFFTPFDRRPFLAGISELGIDYAGDGRGNRIGAAFITGWMAAALGWKLQRAAAGPGGIVAAYYRAGQRTVEVHFRSVRKEHLAPGELSAVRVAGTAGGNATLSALQFRLPSPRTRPCIQPVEKTKRVSSWPAGGPNGIARSCTRTWTRSTTRRRGILPARAGPGTRWFSRVSGAERTRPRSSSRSSRSERAHRYVTCSRSSTKTRRRSSWICWRPAPTTASSTVRCFEPSSSCARFSWLTSLCWRP
ncbi:MAG: hypothetical protein AUH80_02150 [Chloroflexi bacterium 13_1_40CM_4_65_16]|nr:MAG: hypothetical protein AUH80_02150 [Chloroflexi bacterium 13_1_40CM_4_65_16]